MNPLDEAIGHAVRHLDRREIPYMIFGGVANLQWGRPRLTQDVDVKVFVPEPAWAEFVDGLSRDFRLLPGDPIAFARSTHVVPAETPMHVRVDFVLASLPYEREAIDRAVTVALGGVSARLCTAEDLVIHKVLSDRARDREDVEGVIQRQRVRLDRTYLDPRVAEVARDLDRPEILSFYHECLRKAGLSKA